MQNEIPAEGVLPELEVARPTAAMSVVSTLFFIWGFATVLNDILIPHLQNVFSLNNFQAMLVQFAFFTSYFVFAVPWGKAVDRIGYRNTMVSGLVVSAIGCLMFIPAAIVLSYGFFLAALVVLACGITALQVAANPYVTALGSARTASSRLNLAQAFNSLGTAVAPKIGAVMIFTAAATVPLASLHGDALRAAQLQQASSVRLPYTILAVILLLLAALIRFGLPAPRHMDTEQIRSSDTKHGFSILKNKRVLLATIGIFVYVGGEVAIGSFLVKYLNLPEILNVSEKVAGGLVSIYWTCAMVGRFIGAGVLQKLSPEKLLAICAAVAGALVLVSTTTHGMLAAATILAVGLFNSIMFPSIFAIGVEGMGKRTSDASSVMIMAIVGGALIPAAQGHVADLIGIHRALVIPLACYAYILFFGIWGMRQKAS
ncbi:MAG: sugar MFS transporter [Acidobacteria bacterium]|nr:sugar MFS transporter [Acidobacteriota bacterium]